MAGPPEQTVYVAMSGGVDSSVAAALLKKKGHHVVGVYFKPWSPSTGSTSSLQESSGQSQAYCDWQQDRRDAMRVAIKLGIDFRTWDFSEEYGREVAQYMIQAYKSGLTPNPDVMCNKEIKFGLFLKKALTEGADFIATGHYAQVRKVIRNKTKVISYELLKAKDTNKDQTYFLWTLTQDQLKHVLFPIGEYTKPQIRVMAKKFGLPTFDKKDSQGVCFVGQLNMKDFLEKYIKQEPGPIYLAVEPLSSPEAQPLQIGTHDGAAYYTIGQRHGFRAQGGPYYVIAKNIEKNELYVTNKKTRLELRISRISDVHWIMGKTGLPVSVNAKIRYRTAEIPAVVGKDSIRFQKSALSVTPGQSVVFYKGQEVLGGGILA